MNEYEVFPTLKPSWRDEPINLNWQKWGGYKYVTATRRNGDVLFNTLSHRGITLIKPGPACTFEEWDFYRKDHAVVSDWKLVSKDPIYLAAITVFGAI